MLAKALILGAFLCPDGRYQQSYPQNNKLRQTFYTNQSLTRHTDIFYHHAVPMDGHAAGSALGNMPMGLLLDPACFLIPKTPSVCANGEHCEREATELMHIFDKPLGDGLQHIPVLL